MNSRILSICLGVLFTSLLTLAAQRRPQTNVRLWGNLVTTLITQDERNAYGDNDCGLAQLLLERFRDRFLVSPHDSPYTDQNFVIERGSVNYAITNVILMTSIDDPAQAEEWRNYQANARNVLRTLHRLRQQHIAQHRENSRTSQDTNP